MTQKQKSQAVRAAVIGLIGTVLTACGGLGGAAISAAVTVYRVEREMQRVDLPAPGSEKPLTVDTQQIGISYEEAMGLNQDEYYVVPQLGFVLAQPREGWSGVEELTYRDLHVERGTYTGSWWDEQPLRRIRYGEPVEVQYHDGSQVNGVAVDMEMMHLVYNTDTFHLSNEITILALDKEVTVGYTLAEVALEWAMTQRGGMNRIIANKGSDYILMQASWQAQDVQVNGREGDLSLERWVLVAEGPQNYYEVEVVYIPQTGQPVQVWEDLQMYMDSFRVIR